MSSPSRCSEVMASRSRIDALWHGVNRSNRSAPFCLTWSVGFGIVGAVAMDPAPASLGMPKPPGRVVGLMAPGSTLWCAGSFFLATLARRTTDDLLSRMRQSFGDPRDRGPRACGVRRLRLRALREPEARGRGDRAHR